MSRRNKSKSAARRVREASSGKHTAPEAEIIAPEPDNPVPAAQEAAINEPSPPKKENRSAKKAGNKKPGKATIRRHLTGFEKDILRLGGVLLAVTLLSGGVLGWVNGVTADKIADINAQRVSAALEQLIPGARFTGLVVPASADPLIRALWAADLGGQSAGICAQVTPTGFVGEITVIVGIDAEGKIAGVQITDQTETPGLGSRAAQPVWLGQFTGLSGPLNLVKNSSGAESDIVAVTSATVTSAAVTEGVQAALAFAKAYMGVE